MIKKEELFLRVYYKVSCFYITKEPDHIHRFGIGIFDSRDKAENAVCVVSEKPGFCDHKDKLKIKRVLRFTRPRLINKIFWEDGFVTYTCN